MFEVRCLRFEVRSLRFEVSNPNIYTMATITRFEDLEVWQFARNQCKDIFELYESGNFLKDFELINQINRSTGSVMDNIAEGFERAGNKEFIHFMLIAKGSNGEVRSQIYRMKDRCYVAEQKFIDLMTKNETLSKKINAFISYLKSSGIQGFRYM